MSSIAPPASKTLYDYFPLVVPDNRTGPNDRSLLLAGLDSSVLQNSILPFLVEKELTKFSLACHQAQSLVRFFRGRLPHVFKERVYPPAMHIHSVEHMFPFFEVSRVRAIRFLLKTRLHGIVQVDFCLWNYLWTEVNTRCFPNDSTQVFVEVDIRRVQNYKDGSRSVDWLYHNGFDPHPHDNDDDEQEDMGLELTYLEGYDPLGDESVSSSRSDDEDASSMEEGVLPWSVERNMQAFTNYIWICANRVVARRKARPQNVPNLDLLLLQSLPEEWPQYLQKPYKIDLEKAQQNPQLEANWKYRLPLASNQCTTFFDQPKRTNWDSTCYIYKLPWYRDWYPKPVSLTRRDLLGSLPTPLLPQNVSFLGEVDVFSLAEIYPFILLKENDEE